MTALEFKNARLRRKWTQEELARKLRLSQAYVALMESGRRRVPVSLARKVVRVMNMSATTLPLPKTAAPSEPKELAAQLGALGYPGFSHLRGSRKRNPVEVLVSALTQDDLESRITEALPWLMLRSYEMSNATRQWLLDQARLRNLTNRLGFVVSLAKEVAARSAGTTSTQYNALVTLENELRASRLDREDTLCQKFLSDSEREWLRQARPQAAVDWHLLTDWRPEFLNYAA